MSIVTDGTTKVDADAKVRVALLAPPFAALLYPFALEGFNASVVRIVEGGVSALLWLGAALCLALAFAAPLIAVLVAMFLSGIARPTVAQLRAKRVTLFAVAAPNLFTLMGVLLSMLHNPVPDPLLWVVLWAGVLALLLRSDYATSAPLAAHTVPAPLRVAHGLAALALVTIFIALHLANHLMFLAGPETYNAVMKLFRQVYRTELLQPLLVALMLFQIGTGLFFVWRLTAVPSDRFRTFQIASGVYLAFYVLGHMNSVFIFARTYLGIDTDWGFATGAPAGLVKDPWNIRLVPHYWFAVFFVLAHLAAGTRVIMIAHGVSKKLADRLMVGGAVAAGILATLILLGMSGMRVEFT